MKDNQIPRFLPSPRRVRQLPFSHWVYSQRSQTGIFCGQRRASGELLVEVKGVMCSLNSEISMPSPSWPQRILLQRNTTWNKKDSEIQAFMSPPIWVPFNHLITHRSTNPVQTQSFHHLVSASLLTINGHPRIIRHLRKINMKDRDQTQTTK